MPIWGYYKPVITHICKKCNVFMQNLILTMFFVYVIIREEKVWGSIMLFRHCREVCRDGFEKRGTPFLVSNEEIS